MEEIQATISLFLALFYFWGIRAIIKAYFSRNNFIFLSKLTTGVLLFILLNFPLKLYQYYIFNCPQLNSTVKQLIKISVSAYIIAILLFGLWSLARSCYHQFSEKQ